MAPCFALDVKSTMAAAGVPVKLAGFKFCDAPSSCIIAMALLTPSWLLLVLEMEEKCLCAPPTEALLDFTLDSLIYSLPSSYLLIVDKNIILLLKRRISSIYNHKIKAEKD
jgi:hypothetical protein